MHDDVDIETYRSNTAFRHKFRKLHFRVDCLLVVRSHMVRGGLVNYRTENSLDVTDAVVALRLTIPLSPDPMPFTRDDHVLVVLFGHILRRIAQDVWLTLTDYNRLAKYVPNLTQSKLKPDESGRIRLWQEGAQKIVGFDFRASVEMFMNEHFGEPKKVAFFLTS